MKTGSFPHISVTGFDTCLVLHAVNRSYMKRQHSVKETVHKIKKPDKGWAEMGCMRINNAEAKEQFLLVLQIWLEKAIAKRVRYLRIILTVV